MQDITNVLLRESLMEFKAITEELINAVNNDLSEELDRLFKDRQVVINNIQKLQYSKEEFTLLSNELDIINVSKSLDELVEKKRDELKENMIKIRERRVANKSYTQNSSAKKSFFSTKI